MMVQLASGEDEFANVEKINLYTASQETKRNVVLYFDLVLSQLSTDFVNSFNYTKPQENCNEKRLNIFLLLLILALISDVTSECKSINKKC
jgi:hypothetical protein